MSYKNGIGYSSRSLGFTLIEVLVALVVVMVGLAALLQLQTSFIRGASDSEKRAVGMALAEKKLEEFRDYQSIVDYDEIGSTALPTSEIESVSVGNSSVNYTLDWVGINTVSSAVNTSEYKEITVRVNWDGGSLALSTLLARIDPNVAPLLGITGFGGGSPIVSHAAGNVPDVIPIDLGNGDIKETSTPLPEVTKKKNQDNESTEVKFVTTTYSKNSIKQVQEEFLTVNCFCELQSGSGQSLQTPYHYKYENGELVVKKGISYTGEAGDKTGVPDSDFDQSAYCDRCCSGHHDSTDTGVTGIYKSNEVPGFKDPSPSNAHPHYAVDTATGLLTGAEAIIGNTYPEACRFRRVDGVFRLFPDWKMVDLNVMPYDFIASTASSALSDYQSFIVDTIQHQVFPTSSAAMPGGRDFTANNGEITQLLSRGIYYDDLSYDSAWKSEIASIASAGMIASQAWLPITPFFEINTTLLTTWGSNPDAVATVSSDVIDTIEDSDADYYGVYSRGAVTMAVSGTGSAAITAYSKSDNTGLLGNNYDSASSFPLKDNKIIPSPTILSDTIIATIGSVAGGPVIISGTINGLNGAALNKVTLSTSLGDYCTLEKAVGTTRAYNCELPAGTAGVTVTVTPNTSDKDDYFDPTSYPVAIDSVGTPVTGVDFNAIQP
ncbi:Type IV fimbrial biogenesis protein PilV [Marinobacterium lacunae]|uniref:Type IV fimbrial biogenesis protein PilV n=1 Tax=Marinobacterium lacunae TaxID=1232683 RepID=A0A081G174_9GAMM|nr:prepilin-type N-terminal cleavage/methylation domain-containing protein [Marinobacterium lacunae]KEA64529.1 Type IV fimbrial biogenesis protein PilV [Marinobacterium lacunae]